MPGGLMQKRPQLLNFGRRVLLLQRKIAKIGESLGKTTGWIHRLILKQRNVTMINAVIYNKINYEGLHVKFKGQPQILEVDTIVISAAQESERYLKRDRSTLGQRFI
jgi:2,4-dienoyl-CoA reductase (NADPH2)